MSFSSASTPQRRRILIGGAVAVLVIIGVVLGIWLGNRSAAEPTAEPTAPLTVPLPTTYPTEAPPSAPIIEPTEPAPSATTRITSPEAVTAVTVPDFAAEESEPDEEALSEGAVSAQQNTYSSRGEEVDVAASQWETPQDAAAWAEELRAAAPGELIQERSFGPNNEGTYWYYEADGVATQVWLIGDVAGSFTGDPTETQNLALRILASR